MLRISKELFDKNIFEEILDNCENIKERNESKNKIAKQVQAFLNKNKINFLKKIKTKDYTIEEYETFFKLYINNSKIDVASTCNYLFKGKKILSIEVDGYKRKNMETLQEDFKHAKKIKIEIEK
jgi:hypothetical protein